MITGWIGNFRSLNSIQLTNDGGVKVKTQNTPVRWDETDGDPLSDLQAWIEKMKQPQTFRKTQ